MSIDQAINEIVYIGLNAKVGDSIPAIGKLATKHKCSRGIFQRAIAYLNNENIINFQMQKSGTTIVAIDYQKVAEFFYNKMTVSLPLVALNHRLEQLAFNLVNDLTTGAAYNVYLTFSDSSLERIKQLETDQSQLCIISNDFYQTIDQKRYQIIATYFTGTPAYTQLITKETINLKYAVDEICVENILQDNSQYFAPQKYLLVTKPHIAKIINNQKHK